MRKCTRLKNPNILFYLAPSMIYSVPSHTAGSNVLRLTEGQLIDMATGGNDYSNAISSFFSSSFDTTDVSRPHGYLVWMLYDNNMQLIPQGSGAKRVTNPNDLEELIEDEIPIVDNGYLHAYVTNGSAARISFDNFLVTYIRGKTRQINHYYPYGLSIDGLDHSDEYLNKYTSKELQTGEFDSALSSGLEMFDFGSRFYDPQVGRWFTPDPAEQFHNPYLAMGNNPVMYVGPDGEFAWFVPLIFAGVQLGADLIRNDFKMNIGEIGTSLAMGGVQGTIAALGSAGIANTWIAAGSAVGSQINIPIYEGENFSLSVSPSLSAGTNGVRLGMNAIAGVRAGGASFSVGYSFGRNFDATDLGGNMAEANWSSNVSSNLAWSGKGWGISMGNTTFGGNYPQTVANYGFSVGKFSASIQNDFGPAGDGGDRRRTAALKMSYLVNDDLALTAGFSLWTGEASEQSTYNVNGESRPCYYCDLESPSPLRNGNAFIGADYKGLSYAAGINSNVF